MTDGRVKKSMWFDAVERKWKSVDYDSDGFGCDFLEEYSYGQEKMDLELAKSILAKLVVLLDTKVAQSVKTSMSINQL